MKSDAKTLAEAPKAENDTHLSHYFQKGLDGMATQVDIDASPQRWLP